MTLVDVDSDLLSLEIKIINLIIKNNLASFCISLYVYPFIYISLYVYTPSIYLFSQSSCFYICLSVFMFFYICIPPYVLTSYEVKDLDNNIVICKEIFSRCNQYFNTKTKLVCNKQLKAGARLLATAAII